MTILKISIRNFRSHLDKEYIFSNNVNLIVGKNGSGKTTILEAIYYSLQGKSFKNSDKDLLNHNQSWWSIKTVNHQQGKSRKISYDNLSNHKKRRFAIEQSCYSRMPAKFKLPVVLFEPEHLRLLNGSPLRRRQFIDNFICQINPEYQNTINKYERALKQRNTILKNQDNKKEDLFVWDEALSEYGAEIVNKRVLFIETINKKISRFYNEISKTCDEITVHYSNTVIDNTKNRIFSDLISSYQKDKILGFTTCGPHRDDVFFRINDKLALSVASRGEVKTILLALKYIEVNLIKELTNNKPVILLDDVFSELDKDRQQGIRQLTANDQVFITTTRPIKQAFNTNQLLI